MLRETRVRPEGWVSRKLGSSVLRCSDGGPDRSSVKAQGFRAVEAFRRISGDMQIRLRTRGQAATQTGGALFERMPTVNRNLIASTLVNVGYRGYARTIWRDALVFIGR